MTDAAASGAKPPTPTTARPSDKPGKRPSSPTTKGFIPAAAITVAGALITGGLIAASLAPGLLGGKSSTGSYVEPTLAMLPASEIAAATPTLDPATSAKAVTEAKACKAPLASVILMRRPGAPASSGMVRIRSGDYLSPPFQVTDAPLRIAIPYPAPYATGRGVLSLVGDASDIWFYLTPGWFTERLSGAASINVVWTPGNPC